MSPSYIEAQFTLPYSAVKTVSKAHIGYFVNEIYHKTSLVTKPHYLTLPGMNVFKTYNTYKI